MSRLTFGNFNSGFPLINPEILLLSVLINSCFTRFKLFSSSISPLNICFKVMLFFSFISGLFSSILIFGFLILAFNSGIFISVSIFGSFIFTPPIFPFMLKSGRLISFIGLLGIFILGPLILIFPLGISKLRFPSIIPGLLKLKSLLLTPHNSGFIIFKFILSFISQLNNSFNVTLLAVSPFFSLISNLISLRLTSIFGLVKFASILGLLIPTLIFGIFTFTSGIPPPILISVSISGLLKLAFKE